MLFHIYLLGLRALFLTLPSIPIGVTVLRVPTICDDLTVVASVYLQDGTVSSFLCLVTGRLMVLFECLVLHLPLVICQGSPLFWRISSAVGIRLWGQSGLSASGGDRSSARLICFYFVSPPSASFLLFPHPVSPGGLLGCILRSLGHSGSVRFLSFLSSNGGCLESERPFSPGLWSPFSDCGGCGLRSVTSPSPVSGFQSTLNHVLACRTWFARSIVGLSMFLRIFSVPVGPAELHFPPGGCHSLPLGLDMRSVRSFWSLVERFLARSPLFLLALASSVFADILHVLRFESLTPELHMLCPSPSPHFVVAKVLAPLCSSV